jgi:hypothetical protein
MRSTFRVDQSPPVTGGPLHPRVYRPAPAFGGFLCAPVRL